MDANEICLFVEKCNSFTEKNQDNTIYAYKGYKTLCK